MAGIIFLLLIYIPVGIGDIKTKTIPNIYPLMIIAFGSLVAVSLEQSIVDAFMLLLLLLFLSAAADGLLRLMKHGGSSIGGGDIKLLSATAYIIGIYETLWVLFFSQFYVLFFAAACKLWNKKTVSAVPLAPFLLAGLITLLIFKIYM